MSSPTHPPFCRCRRLCPVIDHFIRDNVNVILINLMWIRRLCAKLGERGRHTFVFLFQPFGESSRNRATYLQSLSAPPALTAVVADDWRFGQAVDNNNDGSPSQSLSNILRAHHPCSSSSSLLSFSSSQNTLPKVGRGRPPRNHARNPLLPRQCRRHPPLQCRCPHFPPNPPAQ